MESKAPETQDPLAMARERVQVGAIPNWVTLTDYDKTFTPKIRGQATELLVERHVHAELGQEFSRKALRLETPHSVQNLSQWRIEFSPNTESIVLHSVKTYRGDVAREHASLDKIQFLQRESQLEAHIVHGRATLLLVLEDVAPGDILEYSYTRTFRPKVMPEHTAQFFNLSAGVEIGKYYFLVRHSEQRALKWKSSSPKLEPKITTENGETSLCWLGTQFFSPAPEEFLPPGHITTPWIQISDCPDWQTVARAVLDAWEEDPPENGLNRLVEEVTATSPDLMTRVTRAIELVQDRFRYLSVMDLELGGQIPAVAGTVVRRRYGDCKDLAFLLVRLLRALRVTARPVLVNSGWGQFIATVLPGPGMFNHAIVEYEIGAEKRWVDCTINHQGGGALGRFVPDYGLGLPVDAATTELAPVPKASLVAGSLDIKETLVLDTSGGSSYFATLITAKGPYADRFRRDFANESFEALSKNRLQRCANQFYCKATRINQLEYRDERDINEFVFSEAFEIYDWIKEDKASRTYTLLINSNVTSGALAKPGLAPRREPFALPYPCNRTHAIEIECGSLGSVSLPMVQIGNRFLSFSRRTRSWPKSVKLTFSLDTLAPSIPTVEVPNHSKMVESIWQAANVRLRVPSGYAKPRRRSDFGALPRKGPAPAMASTPAAPPPEKPAPVVAGKIDTVLQGDPPAKPMPPAADGSRFQVPAEESSESRHRSRGLRTEKNSRLSFFIFLGAFVTLFVAGFFSHNPDTRALGGLLGLLSLTSIVGSVVLGVLGWRKCARHPGRYQNSQIFAILTVIFGGLLSLFMVPAFIYGMVHGLSRVRAGQSTYQTSSDSTASDIHSRPLDFSEFNFVLQRPASPWERVNEMAFGTNTTVAFRRPDPMAFTIVAVRIPPMLLDPRKSVVQLSKTSLQKSAGWHNVVKEQEAIYNGVAGWQIETEASIQGHETYFVQWICATNGFGYQLTAWAPKASKSDLLYECDRLFADFELVAPQK